MTQQFKMLYNGMKQYRDGSFFEGDGNGREDILALLSNYKRAFADQYGILALGVFGSVARNEATAESDVDICIKTKTPDAFLLVHIREDLEKLVQRHVDIVRVRDKMNPFLKSRLEKEALYV